MKKKLLKIFLVMWTINFFVLLSIVFLAQLYYPVHSWLFSDQWHWASLEHSMRFYKACVPASFGIAVIITFNEWLEIRKGRKTNQ